jgi:hypothetical protein
MRGRRPGSAPRLLTPGQFIAHVDLMFETVGGLVIKDGHAVEMLALARRHRACAAISVCESWLVWLTQGRDPVVDALPPSERPDPEEVLVVSGTWPVMGNRVPCTVTTP